MNIETIFPRKWLYPEDLAGKAVTVTITEAALVDVRNPRTNKTEPKLAVSFHKASKKLIANKTQAYSIAAIAGSKDTDRWPGVRVTLSAAVAPNGKQTILITPEPHADTHPGVDADTGAGADADADADAEGGAV